MKTIGLHNVNHLLAAKSGNPILFVNPLTQGVEEISADGELQARAQELLEVQTEQLIRQAQRRWVPQHEDLENNPIRIGGGKEVAPVELDVDDDGVLQCQQHHRSGDFSSLFDYEIVHTGSLRPKKQITREVFLRNLKDVNFIQLVHDLELEGEFVLAAVTNNFVKSIGLHEASTQVHRAYAQVRLKVELQADGRKKVYVVGAQGSNHEILLAALAENKSLSWDQTYAQSDDVWRVAATEHLTKMFRRQATQSPTGKKASKERILEVMKSLDWPTLFSHPIFSDLPEEAKFSFVITGAFGHRTSVLGAYVVEEDKWPLNTGRNFQLKFSATKKDGAIVISYDEIWEEGTGNSHLLPSMVYNKSLNWFDASGKALDAYSGLLLQSFEEALFPRMGLKRNLGGWKHGLVASDFLALLEKVNFPESLKDVVGLSSAEGVKFYDTVFVGVLATEGVKWMGLHQPDEGSGWVDYSSNEYFQIKLRFHCHEDGSWSVEMVNAKGNRHREVVRVLKRNRHISLNAYKFPYLLRSPEESLFLELPEFAREELETRLARGGSSVSLSQVSPGILVPLLTVYLLEKGARIRSATTLEETDLRPKHMRRVFHYLRVRDFNINNHRQLRDLWNFIQYSPKKTKFEAPKIYLRTAQHEEGDSPIAEHGWADVFSAGLRNILQGYTQLVFNDETLNNLALHYRKDAYLYLLGAFYGSSFKDRNGYRDEILAQVAQRWLRGDRFPAFYRGWIDMNYAVPGRVYAQFLGEIKSFLARGDARSLTPARLAPGVTSSTSVFLWEELLGDSPQLKQEILVKAQADLDKTGIVQLNLEDAHEQLNGAHLIYYFGELAEEKFAVWEKADSPIFEETRDLFKLLLAFRSHEKQAFRQGFFVHDSQEALATVYQHLETRYPTELRDFLAGDWDCVKNQQEEDGYLIHSLSVSRRAMINYLLRGFNIRDVINILGR